MKHSSSTQAHTPPQTSTWLNALSALKTQLNAFLTLLQNEKAAIKHSKIEALSEIIQEKAQASQALETQMTQLETLAQAEFSSAFTDLLASSEASNSKANDQQILAEIQQLTLACHDLNQANGIAIQILKNMNEFTLSLVSGNDPDFKTYGSKGQKHRSRSGQTLGKA